MCLIQDSSMLTGSERYERGLDGFQILCHSYGRLQHILLQSKTQPKASSYICLVDSKNHTSNSRHSYTHLSLNT